MDPTKPSLSSKSTNINNGAGQNDVAPLEEAAEQWREGGGEVERPREVEREAKVTNGVTPAAETASQHQGAADKHRSNTISYQRRTKQKVVTDFATVSKGMSASAKPRGALRQVLFNQGVSEKGPVPEGWLVEVDIRGLERGQLDALKQALEAFPVPVSLRWSWGEEGTGATLEDSWTDIVHSHTTMCKTQKHQQEALWEFVHTELTYINKLTIVTDLVMSSLTNLHQHGFLQEVTSEQLFSNLPSILMAHQLFWREVMYPMLQEVRRTGKPFDPLKLEAGCLQFHERFSTYLQYCWEEENTVEFTHRLLDTNLHFHTYMQWVETHPQCERMRLGDMQAKPHQRITKYPLLLKAVHKNTQDPHTEHTLRGMLTSVNGFLDSINDYLRLKDEELALSISAQRVEGYYATDGMNEEIDKHVREFCHFDLTRPIRGVGPGVIRKLLLEETLKIRCRKDSKLEVMALLFSDVLLVTKAQKKAERLKVVRPPLALDRTRCAVLKDGCSFVLVEVSDLGCAMNVYTFSTSSPENCSKWVSTIQEAQETLQALSRTETSRQLKANQRLSQSEAPPPSEPKVANEETVELPPDQSQVETLVASIATEADLQTHEPLKKKGCFFQGPQYKFSDTHSQLVNRTYSHWPIKNGREGKAMDGVKMSGVGVREYRDSNQSEENYGTEFLEINERRATWNQSRHSVPDISNSYISTGNTASTFKPKHHSLLLGGYPDIDYPFTQSSTNLSPCRENHPEGSMGQSEFPGAVRTMRQDSDSQSVEQGARRDSWYSQSREEEALAEVQKFSRKLKSPRLHRRRPIHAQQDAPPQMLRRGSVDSGVAWSIPYTNSSSNSDSDCNQKLRGNSRSKGQSNNSHLVLKLGSLKMNRGVLWNISAEKVSPDPHTFSEPELPREVPDKKSQKRPKLKTQRSISIPDIVIQGGHGALLTPSRPSRAGIAPSPPPGLDRQLYPSPLEGLLERAKDRRRDRYGGKLEGREKTPNFQTTDLLHSPSVSTTLSQSPSKGDRGTEWEEVQLFRCRAPTVSEGWREAWVDGDEEKKTSFPFPDGASVDWPGWCFDDNEVMDRLTPEDSGGRDEGLWEGLSRSLTLRDFQQIAHQEDGQCSQV